LNVKLGLKYKTKPKTKHELLLSKWYQQASNVYCQH